MLVMSVLCFLMTILSLVVYLSTKSSKISAEKLEWIGALYIICGCLAMSVAEVSLLKEGMRDKEGLSGMCIWLVMFPLLIPAHPTKTLATAWAAASMLPLSYFIGAEYFGTPVMRTTFLVDWFSALYFCAGLSYVASNCVYRWGSELAKAQREIQKLGSYELIEPIGKGGMGVVWKARHRALSREAAIKLIYNSKLEEANVDQMQHALSLFEKEAQAIAALGSPHTISLYDFGMTDEGNMYYAMELLNGPDLDYLVEAFGPQPAGRVAHIIAQACLSLDEAHNKGQLHRDVKPANIMLCKPGRRVDHVKVLDFGLVKLFDDAIICTDEIISGTSAFIAPESLLMEKQSPATDIYSLGCVAYWLLTGTTVFKNQTIEEDMQSHVKETAERPSMRLGYQVPEELEDIILKCLEKDPKNRFQSAEYLRQKLLECACCSDWTEQEAQNWWLKYEQHKKLMCTVEIFDDNPRLMSVALQ